MAEAGDEKAVQAVADEIRRYLAVHPSAADSIEGIHRWWLSRERAHESAETVGRALEVLVAEGLLMRRRLPDHRLVYASDSRRPGRPG